MSRKMAWIARIDNVEKHPNADALDICTIGGWKVVTKLGEFNTGQLAVYFSIDSWIPHELAPFLSNGKEPREFEGVKGERLRTIKLRGTCSQGLLLPFGVVMSNYVGEATSSDWNEDDDVTELLGILKYERPLPAQLAGQAKGNFPSFIPKTDEERVQNLSKNLGKWSQSDDQWEISEKLDGSSMTVFFRNNAMTDADDFIAEFGVCSRNLQLKETEGNSFWGAARKYTLEEKLTALDRNIAIQGELCGVGIQGNKYKLNDIDFYVFTIYDIDKGEYLSSAERLELCEKLGLKHVPVLGTMTLENQTIDSLLQLAESKSELNVKTEREGLVFKCITDTRVHFKAISNKFLMKFED
jgi:RNA ligase (TIGR02306 family)